MAPAAAPSGIDVVNAFHFEKSGSSMPYRMQGESNPEFESSPAREQRSAIKQSAKLRSATMQFWTTAGLKPDECMPRSTYIYIHRRISRVLAPELTEEEAEEAAEEDWLDDLKGEEEMTFEM